MFGSGSIAEAMIKGILAQPLTTPDQVSVMNRSNEERLQQLHDTYKVNITFTAQGKEKLVHEADVILLCVKPKDAVHALHQLKTMMRTETLLVSVVAGLSLQAIQQLLGTIAVVRAMPNTSSMIRLGVTALCYSPSVRETERAIAIALFQAIGITIEVEEQQMDIVTALSGSGPAYVYYMMEAMMQAGMEGGLAPQEVKKLTVQTFLGAAEMVRLTAESPAVLRRKVTSPHGTTQAALDIMDTHQLEKTIRLAVHRAAERSLEIEQQLRKDIDTYANASNP